MGGAYFKTRTPGLTYNFFDNPETKTVSPRVDTAPHGVETVRGGVDQGDHRFRSRIVGVADVWRNL